MEKMNCKQALAMPRPSRPSGLPVILVAAAAMVDSKGAVLLTQRPEAKAMAGLWEFPGGKLKEGESPEYALMRELEEELGIETRECCFSPIGFASHQYDDFHLLMPLFICRIWRGDIKPMEGQKFAWVYPQDMYDYPMPEADMPLVYQLRDRL